MQYNLRRFQKKDVDSITKYANNKNIAKWLTNEFPYPYSKEDAEFFINMVSKEDPNFAFAIEINEEAVGSIAITPESDNNKNNINNNFDSDNNIINENKENLTQNDQLQETKINICDKQAELGYWLAEKYWNKGIMTSAIKKMVDHGFKTFDINCIFATPFVKNTASQKVLKKVGFSSDGKSRKIIKNNETYEVFIFLIKKNQKINI